MVKHIQQTTLPRRSAKADALFSHAPFPSLTECTRFLWFTVLEQRVHGHNLLEIVKALAGGERKPPGGRGLDIQ